MTYSINRKHPAYIYAKQVVDGKIIACENEILACNRHLNDLKKQGTKDFPYVFDETRAERIYYYFSICRIHQGPQVGEYMKLFPHQYFDFGVLFGWVHKDTGKRRFVRGLKFVGRGNLKSSECSVIALFGLTSDCLYPPFNPSEKIWDNNPFIECIAVDKQQAQIVREAAMKIAEKSKKVAARAEVKKTYIQGRIRGGYIKALSKEYKNKDGGSPNIVIVDELSAHTSARRINTIFGGFGKRIQSLMVSITTAGDNVQNNPGKKEYDKAVKVLRGEIKDETFYSIIRELDKDDDPHNKEMWTKANPMLRYDGPYSKNLMEQIEIEYKSAYEEKDGDKIYEFLTKRMNIWETSTQQKFLNKNHLAILESLKVDQEEFRKMIEGRSCICGIDASKKVDLTADAFIFSLPGNKIGIDAYGFIPSEGVIRHERTDRISYRHWIQEGWVNQIDGEVIDTALMADHVIEYELEHSVKVEEVTYDPAFCYQMAIDLTEGRNSYKKKYTCVEIPQTYAQLNEPTELFKLLILEKRLVWTGSPCFLWCCENAYATKDNGERVRLSKKTKDDSQRIDLLSAAINGLKRIHMLKKETVKDKIRTGKFSF